MYYDTVSNNLNVASPKHALDQPSRKMSLKANSSIICLLSAT